MLHILTIAFVLAIKNGQILMFSRITFQKGGNLVVILGFPPSVFRKKNLCTLFVLHNKDM